MSALERMHDRFVRLCEAPSPTGGERAVTDLVATELRDLGVEVSEDGAAGPARAGAGNLIARVPGRGGGWVMLCAHLETAPGRAAVAVLVELAARATAQPAQAGIELVLTVAGEDGLRGAKELDVDALRSPFGFVLGHPSPIGEVLTAGPTQNRVVAEFEGAEAHAGIRPDDGHSAIAAAAGAVASMRLGRLDAQTTANVGVISGGSSAGVVARHCRIEGETRALDAARATEATEAMVDACTWAASEHACDVDIDVTEIVRGYRVPSSSPPLRVATEALRRCGHEPRELATAEGSEANVLIARGFECVLLATGTEASDTAQEHVAAPRIDELLAVCEAIVEIAGEREC